MIVKVCGMREGYNILAVDALGVDLMGFIFYPKSPRYVGALPSSMPHSARRVGVFVNESLDVVCSKIQQFGLHYVQLHGAESVEYCRSLANTKAVEIIKVFSVDEQFDFDTTDPYDGLCKLFLFDTKCGGYGGSGEQFDWSVLSGYKGSTPFLLSGGIGESSVNSLREFSHPMLEGYDLNSRFEIEAAVKSTELLTNFLEQLKK